MMTPILNSLAWMPSVTSGGNFRVIARLCWNACIALKWLFYSTE
jgi:hypothetical protein